MNSRTKAQRHKARQEQEQESGDAWLQSRDGTARNSPRPDASAFSCLPTFQINPTERMNHRPPAVGCSRNPYLLPRKAPVDAGHIAVAAPVARPEDKLQHGHRCILCDVKARVGMRPECASTAVPRPPHCAWGKYASACSKTVRSSDGVPITLSSSGPDATRSHSRRISATMCSRRVMTDASRSSRECVADSPVDAVHLHGKTLAHGGWRQSVVAARRAGRAKVNGPVVNDA
jgi:hypothetical protein